jgi:diacylglycerol O-acyltransferase
MRNETSRCPSPPRTILNQRITGARRFAAQDWPLERLRAIGKATGTTMNDVVLAMCSGALRTYLLELDALPDTSLVSMVPVGLNAKQSQHVASSEGGNAVGTLMVKLGTDLADPGDRLQAIHASMADGKEALASMTKVQILAMSALGRRRRSCPMLRCRAWSNPPYNLVDQQRARAPHRRSTTTAPSWSAPTPLSIPITARRSTSPALLRRPDGFGLTGCRRTVPHLQRLLGHLDDALVDLERAAGMR